MAKTSDRLRWLLKVYPAKTLRDYWSPEARKKDKAIAEIVERVSEKEIHKFADTYFGITRQHVQLYSHTIEDLEGLPDDILGLSQLIHTHKSAERAEYFYLVDLEYTVVVDNPLATTKLLFSWPVRITFDKETICARLTTMEQHIQAYVAEDRPVIKSKRALTERSVLEVFLGRLPANSNVASLDLNKGTKALWASCRVDAPSVQYKKPTSTSKEDMDEDFLVKRDNPDLYSELQDKPLFKALFRFSDETDRQELVPHFTIDPTEGIIVFSVFPNDQDSTDNVIREILRLN